MFTSCVCRETHVRCVCTDTRVDGMCALSHMFFDTLSIPAHGDETRRIWFPHLPVFLIDLLSDGDSVYSRENSFEVVGIPVKTCLICMGTPGKTCWECRRCWKCTRNHFKCDLLLCGEKVFICFIFTDRTCIRFDGGNHENIDIDGDTNIHKLIHIHVHIHSYVHT